MDKRRESWGVLMDFRAWIRSLFLIIVIAISDIGWLGHCMV